MAGDITAIFGPLYRRWWIAAFDGRKGIGSAEAKGGEVNAITALDYAGVSLFAATGALAASRKQLDIIGRRNAPRSYYVLSYIMARDGGGTRVSLSLPWHA